MSVLYRPKHQHQGDPADSGGTGWVDCGPHALAMGIDAVTHGAVVPTGRQVRVLTNEPVPQPGDPGVTHAQLLAAVERFGAKWTDEVRPWRTLEAALAGNRWACLSVWYPGMGQWMAQRPGEFGHDIGVMGIGSTGNVLVFDPLAKQARWIPMATVRAAAEEWGRRSGTPGKVRFLLSSTAIPYA